MKYFLEIKNANTLIKSIAIDEGDYILGNAHCADPNFILLKYPTISKQHAKIRINNKVISIKDLGSTNSTLVQTEPSNISKITSEKIIKLGQIFFIGPFSLSINETSIDSNTNLGNKYWSELYLTYLRKNISNPFDSFISAHKKEIGSNTALIEYLHNEFYGDGPLVAILESSLCKDLLINSYDQIFVDSGEGLIKANVSFHSESTYLSWIFRKLNSINKRIDLNKPICNAMLKDGSRINVVLSPIASQSPSVSIRKFSVKNLNVDYALQSGWMNSKQIDLLKTIVSKKLNIIISGGTSSGKTSLLNFLCGFIPEHERLVTIEDTRELSLPNANLVQLEARETNAENYGEVSLNHLIQTSLRMRPDRIIVGECRGSEVFEMLQAFNTGHPGSMTTIHANSCTDAILRLELLLSLGNHNISHEMIKKWIASSIDCIIQLDRTDSGKRIIQNISLTKNGFNKLNKPSDFKETNELWLF